MKKLAYILILTLTGLVTLSVMTKTYIPPQPYIGFAENSSQIEPCNDSTILNLMIFFTDYPNGQIEIRGFAGVKEDSLVSYGRASAVRDLLINKGIDQAHLIFVDKGKEAAPFYKEIQIANEPNEFRIEAVKNNRVVTFSILTMD